MTLRQLQDKEATKKVLDETEKMLDEIDGVTPTHGKYVHTYSKFLFCQVVVNFLMFLPVQF